MPGRPLLSEDDPGIMNSGFNNADSAQRRLILNQTLQAFTEANPRNKYSVQAEKNLRLWKENCQNSIVGCEVLVLAGDWGEVTLELTKKYGKLFAVLNMANAYVPGGAYVEGAIAQEENMYRRTDCHFHIRSEHYNSETDCYYPEFTQLLEAKDGGVYLDKDYPRVCIRGPEDRSRSDLGYAWLPDYEIFPFFELRASAQDLRDGSPFKHEEARRRIAAQLDTLQKNCIRHAVLGAFGCGAFLNLARQVAKMYKEEIARRSGSFSVIAFAIFSAGYGPGNYASFAEVFANS